MPAVPRSRYVIYAALAGSGCMADLTTKRLVFDWLGLPSGRVWWLWTDVFGFETSLNPGGLAGYFQGNSLVLAGFSLVALVGIVGWLFVGRAAVDRVLTVALGLISGGILGNLYDRLGLHGLKWAAVPGHIAGEPMYAVRDWVLMMIGPYKWPNYNIADSLLVTGAGLLVLHALWWEKPKAQQPPV